jgi:hypothetical protein
MCSEVGSGPRPSGSIKVNRFYLAPSLIGIAIVVASVSIATRSYAEGQPQTTKTTKPEAQALWVLSSGNYPYTPSIAIFQPARLKMTGTVASFGIYVGGAVTVSALTFDSNHDLWIGLCGNYNAGYLAEVTAAGLRKVAEHGEAKFSVVIQDPVETEHHAAEYLTCPQAMQFDPSGNLWVAPADIYYGAGTPLLEYTSDQLQSSGKPAPAAVIETPTEEEFYGRITLAFDHLGNLWQSSSGIFEYTAAQLAAGVQTDPYQTLLIGGTLPELDFPSSIAFDASGNLWVTFADGGIGGYGGLESFPAGELNGQGTVTPTAGVTIETAAYRKYLGLASPDTLSFDNEGDLWIGNTMQPKGGLGDGSVTEFTSSELSTSGNPIPTREILANPRDINLGRPSYITFGPALP